MEKIKFDCHGHNAPAYGCNKPGDNSGWYYQSTDIDDLFEKLLSLPEAKKQLQYLRKGIGTSTENSVWLDIANAISA